jgi:ABC-2 type transport system permease protein
MIPSWANKLFIPYFQIEADVLTSLLILVTLLTLASMFIGMLFSIAIPSQLKATWTLNGDFNPLYT